MDRKTVIIKKESKIRNNEESRIQFSNSVLIRTKKSETFSESCLTETEISISNVSMDSRNRSTERTNRGLSESNGSSDSPKMGIFQKNHTKKATTLDNINQTNNCGSKSVDGGNLMDSKPSTAMSCPKVVRLQELKEVPISPESSKDNPSQSDTGKNNLIIDAKKVACNPLIKLHSNTNEVFENYISEKSPIKNPENKESRDIKLAPEEEKNIPYTGDIPTEISYISALNSANAGKISTECNNLMTSRLPNVEAKNSESKVHTHIKKIDKRKHPKEYKYFSKVVTCENGDNLVSSEDKGTNDKVGVFKGKVNSNKSVCHLVNYFENMKKPSPSKTILKSYAFRSGKRKPFETTVRHKRKLANDHSLPNKKTSFHDSSKSYCLPIGYSNVEDCTIKTCFASKNIGLFKKLNETVQPYYSDKKGPNFNFNDDTAEFCVVKCKQTHISSKKLIETPRQPREKSFILARKAMEQSNEILTDNMAISPKSHPRNYLDLQISAKENFNQANLLLDKSTKTEENVIDDNSFPDHRNASVGGIKLILFNKKSGYQHKKFNKAIIDNLRNDLKEGMTKIEEPTHKDENGESLEKEDSSFVKCFTSLILFMVVFAFGSYYKFFQ